MLGSKAGCSWVCLVWIGLASACSDGQATTRNAGEAPSAGGRAGASSTAAEYGGGAQTNSGGASLPHQTGSSGKTAQASVAGNAGAAQAGGASSTGAVNGGAAVTAGGVSSIVTGGTSSVGTGGTSGVGAGGTATASGGTSGAAGAAVQLLSQTGLYEADMKTIRAGNIEYRPRFELWSDGATKRRWIRLPEGSFIDTSDPDYWLFPVGTKVWKEFAKNGKRIETRIIERSSTRSYRMVAYLWRDDASDAVAVPDGQANAHGTDHDVPSSAACDTCHQNQPGRIVGVSAIQLDHASAGLTLAALEAAGRLSSPLPASRQLPGDATAQSALGTLHSNCGICHNPRSQIPFKTLDLWLRLGMLGKLEATPMYVSTVGVATESNPDPTVPKVIVVPGNPSASALVHRMGSRTERIAMPPLATEAIDPTGLATVTSFIASMKP